MNKRVILWVGIAIVGAAGLIGALYLMPNQETLVEAPTKETTTPAVDTGETVSVGRYEQYSESTIAAKGYSETILFFHAPWCPECRAFETAIVGSDIPEGVQILKVDYDSATELRQKYGITLQSTFVSVDDSGAEISSWAGYGKEKSVNAILENT